MLSTWAVWGKPPRARYRGSGPRTVRPFRDAVEVGGRRPVEEVTQAAQPAAVWQLRRLICRYS